jgi:hypothetical protein
MKLQEDFGVDPGGDPGPGPEPESEDGSVLQHARWIGENLTVAEEKLGEAKVLLEESLTAPRLVNTRRTMETALGKLNELTKLHGDVRIEADLVAEALEESGGGPSPPPPPPPTQDRKRVFVVFPGGGWMPPGPVPARLMEKAVAALEDHDVGFKDADDQDKYEYFIQSVGQFFDELPNMDYVPGWYRGGNGVQGVASDMATHLQKLTLAYDDVFVAGHSAGITALTAILNPAYGVDVSKIRGFVSIAGAGLSVKGSDQIRNPMTAQLFNSAWGDRRNWEKYSPDTYATARTERFPLIVLDGSVDDQLERVWAQRGVQVFKQAGWDVWPDPWVPQTGGDHFNMNPPFWPNTVRLIRQLVG